MKSIIKIVLLPVLIVLMFSSGAPADTFDQTVSAAMKSLKVEKDAPGLLVMTNAPYVKADGACALPFLDAAQKLTGSTVGNGRLLFFQRPQSHPLRLMLFKKDTGDAVIISKTDQAWSTDTLNMGPKAIADPEFWKKAKDFHAGGDMFTLAALANVWAAGGPYDFLKSAELHNHICPGLTSGYLMAHYILKHYPLEKGQRYTIVASPVWCKEDAFQVVMDCTPGKKGLVVKPLSKQQVEKITVANPAGMVLIWDRKEKTGKGVVLSFDFEKIRALSPKGAPKAATVLDAADHLNDPDRFVSTGAEFDLTQALYQGIMEAGNNPYELAGLVKK